MLKTTARFLFRFALSRKVEHMRYLDNLWCTSQWVGGLASRASRNTVRTWLEAINASTCKSRQLFGRVAQSNLPLQARSRLIGKLEVGWTEGESANHTPSEFLATPLHHYPKVREIPWVDSRCFYLSVIPFQPKPRVVLPNRRSPAANLPRFDI